VKQGYLNPTSKYYYGTLKGVRFLAYWYDSIVVADDEACPHRIDDRITAF
jgi:hypothetical protein